MKSLKTTFTPTLNFISRQQIQGMPSQLSLILPLFLFFCILGNSLHAQIIGFRGGLNLAEAKSTDSTGQSPNLDKLIGFHAGVTYEHALNDNFSLESGLFFTIKGARLDEDLGIIKFSGRTRIYYVEIPLVLRASAILKDQLGVYANFGPYIGMGLSGKMKSELTFMGETEREEMTIPWGNDEDELSRFDAGLTMGGGFDFDPFSLGIHYDLGLYNLNNYQDDIYSTKHRVIRFSLSYRLSRE